jgi:hypothetical protein
VREFTNSYEDCLLLQLQANLLRRYVEHTMFYARCSTALKPMFVFFDGTPMVADGSGSMTLIELDEWIKSMGINDLSFADVQVCLHAHRTCLCRARATVCADVNMRGINATFLGNCEEC